MPLACMTDPVWVLICGAAILIEPPAPLIWALSAGAGADAGAVVALAVMVAVGVAVTLELAVKVIVPPEVLGAALAAVWAVWI